MNKPKAFELRPLLLSDQRFLWEMLYQSLYVPAGRAPFARSILRQPELAVYVKDWGARVILASWLSMSVGKLSAPSGCVC
jgi:hypothetical protein